MFNVNSSLANLAVDTLYDAEVMQEFDDTLWVKIDRELWEMFQEQLAQAFDDQAFLGD